MSNNFCRFLSNGLTLWNDNSANNVSITPCCYFKDRRAVDLSIKGSVSSVRQEFAQITDWTNNCFNCKELENAGIQSLRQTSFDWIPDVAYSSIHQLDLRLDINCNAACVICNKSSSTLWIKEHNKFFKKTIPVNTIAPESKIKKIIDSLDLESLTYIKFYGGEPLFTDAHYQFLKQIKNPERVTLQYTTNGSIYPKEEVLELWDKFKLILFCVSADGIDKQFDYIRWPLKWDKVTGNLFKLIDHAPVNVMFRFEYTVNFLNAFYFKEFEEWVNQNFSVNRLGDPVEINIHPCYENAWSIDKISTPLYERIVKKYSKDHRLLNLIRQYTLNGNLESWKTFVSRWDTIRHSKWQDAFPELSDLYE